MRSTLLNTEFTRNGGQRDLPPILLFYIILKHSNISTELGIVNGAPGIKDGNGVKRFKCTQAPFEPAFGITGHGVQGQTRLHVIADLHDGSFASYVAASRPTSRSGLAILRQVSLENLNKPLPFELLCEDERHKLMAENTVITHGFMIGVLRSIPDVELEKNVSQLNLPSPFKQLVGKRTRKRATGEDDAHETVRVQKKAKTKA